MKQAENGYYFMHRQVAPSRERGLKLLLESKGRKPAEVAPSRERGLKPIQQEAVYLPRRGRSFAGAWIETYEYGFALNVSMSLLRGSVD